MLHSLPLSLHVTDLRSTQLQQMREGSTKYFISRFANDSVGCTAGPKPTNRLVVIGVL